MLCRALAAAYILQAAAFAQAPIYIDTLAGAGLFDSLPARETPLVQPQAIWLHTNGDLYISDGNFVVRRVRNNQSTIVAGGGHIIDDSIPVSARDASLDYPSGVAVTPDGSIYICDVRHHRIRRITPDGRITTVVGTGVSGYSGDGGPGTIARLKNPAALTLGPSGDLVFADDNFVIRRYQPGSGIVTTIAGTGEFGNTGDGGPARQATLGVIRAIAYDRAGNLYVADRAHFVIRRISPDGRITRFAGTGAKGYSGDGGQATGAEIGTIIGMAADASGNLYLSDSDAHRIRRISPAGVITTIAGKSTPRNPGAENQLATELTLLTPGGLAVDAEGNLVFAEIDGHVIRRISAATGLVTTIAGTADPYDGKHASESLLTLPSHVAVDGAGNVYIADQGKLRIRKIAADTGIITTVAGDGREAGSVNGTDKSIGRVVSISMGSRNQLWIADRSLGLIRRVDLSSGVMTTVLDLTRYSWARNSVEPSFVIEASDGSLFISEWMNDVVLWFSPQRELYIVAGTEGVTDYTGDGGPASSATLNGPEGIALDNKGGLLICDSFNHVVRRVDLSTEVISTFAGDGLNGADYDGFPAVQASMREPSGIAVDGEGYTYISDSGAHQIRLVTPAGIILTLAGNDTRGFSGDGGPAVLSNMDEPFGIAVYQGSVLVIDSRNYRLRLIFVKDIPNLLQVKPGETLSFRGAEGGDLPSVQLLSVDSSIVGVKLRYKIDGGTYEGGAWLNVDELEGETPNIVIVQANTTGMKAGTYTGILRIGTPGSYSASIPVELRIDPPDQVRAVKLSSDLIRFTVPAGTGDTSTLRVSAPGNQALDWSVRFLTESPWLKLSATSGQTPANIQVRVDSASLSTGVHTAVAYFEVPDGSPTLFVVTATVTEAKPVLTLDTNSFVFDTVEGTTAIPDQLLSILNTGSADLNWELSIPSTVNWLRASSAKGTVAAGDRSAAIQISASPAGLAAGDYSALIDVRAADAVGAPQSISVRMRVQPAGTAARAVFDRTALAFFGAPGAAVPEQIIRLSSTGGSALAFSTTVRTANGGRWLSVTPGDGTIGSSSQTYDIRVTVSPAVITGEYQDAAGCPRPAYCGTLTYTFSDGSVQEITILLVLRTPGAEPSLSKNRSATCSPARQLVLSASLPSNFSVSAGWPVALKARVFDDCGSPMTASTVTATFSNGDPALRLRSLKNGDYTGTWTPTPGSANTSITMRALHPELQAGEWVSGGNISEGDNTPPILLSGGIMNAASRRKSDTIAHRSMIVLQGSNFPATAAQTTVLIGGQQAQVLSAQPDEIRALVPGGIEGPVTSVLVGARGFVTAPQSVSLVPNDPGLFPVEDGVTVPAGSTMTITGTGFGAVDGEGNVVERVSAKLADREVQIESVTLPANADGVYRVKVKLPAEVTGDQKLTVTQKGAVSNEVTLRITAAEAPPPSEEGSAQRR